jgi:arsenite methyltransferase
MTKHDKDQIKRAVREHYGNAIQRKAGSCCGASDDLDPNAAGRFVQLAGYKEDQITKGVTSFGCGNPVDTMDVRPGRTVLDLGSGAGLDLILASKKVGPGGRVIGLDMTPEMIETCRRNLNAAGVTNADIRLGEIEQMPLNDNEVDWIISNCVINLSPEKKRVFAEAYRVLKPGGRVMVSDIVTIGLPDDYRNDIAAWVGCIAGAVDEREYTSLMREAGFEDIEIVDRIVYSAESLDALVDDACGCSKSNETLDRSFAENIAGHVASVKVSARKPVRE